MNTGGRDTEREGTEKKEGRIDRDRSTAGAGNH